MNPLTIGFPSPTYHFGIERFSNRHYMAQAAEIMLCNSLVPCTHKHAERGRGTVPDADFIFLNGAVPILRAEPAPTNNIGHSIQPRSKDSVRGTCYPAWVSRTPVHVIFP